MTDKALKARRAYKRQWAKNHPDKIRAQQERYWNKRAAAVETVEITPADQMQAEAAAEPTAQ